MSGLPIRDTLVDILGRDDTLLNLLMNNVPDYIFLKNKELQFVQVNRPYAEMIGLADPLEVAGKTDNDFFRAFDLQVISESEKNVVETGKSAVFVEQRVLNKRGSILWLSGHRIPVRNVRGEVVGLIGLVRDITYSKKVEQELRNVNMRLSQALSQLKQTQLKVIQHERLNALGEMASGIAHDFNNALMPILGYTDVMISRPELLSRTEESLEMLKDIREAAMGATQAVRRLREFYRTSAANEQFKGDLNKQIETAVILTKPRWQSEMAAMGVQINVKTNLLEVPVVNAKESQLREILINLILNSVDAMPAGGTITINSRMANDKVVLEVCDTGVGMTDEVRRKCFDPFFTTKGDEGTGLGLSMLYGFVKRLNGTVDIESVVGKGTKVVICLPSGECVDGEQKSEMVFPVVSHKRVLVIDDEASARKLLGMYLKADNHHVEFAESGKDALEKFRSGSFDLVITDRAMPDMSGDQVASAVRAANRGIPVIMVTGFGDIMGENRQCPEGVAVVVSKPVTQTDLRNAIMKAVEAQRLV